MNPICAAIPFAGLLQASPLWFVAKQELRERWKQRSLASPRRPLLLRPTDGADDCVNNWE